MAIEKTTYRAEPFQDIMAEGVRVGDQLTLAGQVAMDQAGNVVGVGDIVAQFAQCYANLQHLLSEFGADLSNVVDEMIFVTDFDAVMSNIEPLTALRTELFGGAAEASQTMVEVSRLVFPGLMVEVKCIARL